MERAESTPVAPLSTPKAPNASAQTQVPNTPSEATATQKLIDTFEALPGNATMEERFVVLKEGAKNPEFRKEYPISIKGYEAYIKKHPDQISDSAKPKDSGKSKAEIGSAIRALDAGSVTVADRIAGMKELLKTPEFIQYYPDLAKTYKKAIVNAGQ